MQLKINAEKLKQLRESKCWSQQQLSELSGLSLRTIQRIEAKSVASQESIKCLAAVFEIQVQTLFEQPELTIKPDNVTSPLNTSEQPDHLNNEMVQEVIEPNDVGKLELKRLYIAFALVFASHMFGFYGIFSAFAEHRLDVENFQLLKNVVSGALLFSTAAFLYRFVHLRKKYGVGSSLL